MIDNRINLVEGKISNASDIDELYRDLCSHHGEGLSKMKAFTKSQRGINMKGLILLCMHFNLKIVIDQARDYFAVYYADEGVSPIENPVVNEEDTEEVVEEKKEDEPASEEDSEFKTVGGGNDDNDEELPFS